MSTLLASITGFFGSNPTLRAAQLIILGMAMLLLFLLFYVLKDSFSRTRSFWLQAFYVLLTALLPIVGFLLYILLRPHRTLREREMDAILMRLAASLPTAPEAPSTPVSTPPTPSPTPTL